MRSRRLAGVVSAIAAGGWFAWAVSTTPPATSRLDGLADAGRPLVRGAYHVHSRVSDGTGSITDIAEAATAARLGFVILTDHGDGTRPVPPPRFVNGVLCIEAVELSTAQGHYAALGLPTAPYPLAGEARDVIEDVARLGGFGIATHPDSAKTDLQWRAWDEPFPAIEWFNGDSQWRDEARLRFPPVLVRYLRRPAETVATLFDRPVGVLNRWDRLSRKRPVVGLAGHDAHQRLGFAQGDEPGDAGIYLPIPSYRNVFRAFSTVVEIDGPLTGRAAGDAAAVIGAIRAGRIYSAIDAVAGPAQVRFSGHVGSRAVRMGERVPLDGPVALRVRSNGPAGSEVVLLRDGSEVARSRGTGLDWYGDRPGVYRVEIQAPGAPGEPPIPWVVTNPIAIGVPTPTPPAGGVPQASPWAPGGWRVEHSPRSSVRMTDGRVGAHYALASDLAESPFAAIVTDDVAALTGAAALQATITANGPMRLSVQVRAKGTAPNARWVRSVYVDTGTGTVTLPFDGFRPVVPGLPPLSLEAAGSLLFVVDTTNARAGSQGRFSVDGLALVRATPVR